ncbi:MAG: hypothetical protein Q4E54_06880 [Lachnospiraceae bacterium]|nr:hypothetical protein [Lachnospiraceae bacterium]
MIDVIMIKKFPQIPVCGFLYYGTMKGCDELNMSCLKWLDGFGNGQINEKTKKIPRDMFRNEYLKLQHVYERKECMVFASGKRKHVVSRTCTGQYRQLLQS